MIRFLIITILLCFNMGLKAQKLSHHFSYNVPLYFNYYNEEKDNINFKDAFFMPVLSYNLTIKRISIEFFLNPYHVASYHELESVIDSTLLHNSRGYGGLCFGYKLIQKKQHELTPFLGPCYGEYFGFYVIGFFNSPGWREPVLEFREEKNFGLSTGINYKFFFWSDFFLNLNYRFMYYPSAEFNTKNSSYELGIGYRLQRKR